MTLLPPMQLAGDMTTGLNETTTTKTASPWAGKDTSMGSEVKEGGWREDVIRLPPHSSIREQEVQAKDQLVWAAVEQILTVTRLYEGISLICWFLAAIGVIWVSKRDCHLMNAEPI